MIRTVVWQGDNAIDVADLLGDDFHHKNGVLMMPLSGAGYLLVIRGTTLHQNEGGVILIRDNPLSTVPPRNPQPRTKR